MNLPHNLNNHKISNLIHSIVYDEVDKNDYSTI